MSDSERLRARLSDVAGDLGKEFPPQMLARAFIAAGCDVSLSAVGMAGAVRMTESATNLLAGHWSEDRITDYLETTA